VSYQPWLTSAQRAALDRSRENYADRLAEEAAAIQRNEEIQMSTFKTKQGDRAKRPPTTDDTRTQIDALFGAAAETLDAVTEAARRESTIEKTATVDRTRFPVIGGGQR